MNFLHLAKNRYTTKQYDADKKVPDEKIEELKEILRLSPSSINSQPWKFIFVSDEKRKRQLASASLFNEEKINQASHLVVFMAIDDIFVFENKKLAALSERVILYYNRFVKPQGEAAVKSWLQHQVYLSLGFFLSACAAMDIDATPMEGIQTDAYDNILHPHGYKTLFAVAIGYRHQNDSNQPALTPKWRLPLADVVQSDIE